MADLFRRPVAAIAHRQHAGTHLMRLVFVNHAHPDLPHVSAMRLSYFAQAMAARGHRVLLLTCAVPGTAASVGANTNLSERLADHNWSVPCVVAVSPQHNRLLAIIRGNRAPSFVRRVLTLGQFLVHGGVFADWQVPALSVTTQIAREFHPELVWGTFGNTSTLVVAQAVARAAKCPWLLDIKDPWSSFVPLGLRRLMARRFRGAWGLTSNSQSHQAEAHHWLHQSNTTVIYSGVADAFYAARVDTLAAKHDLVLVGSTYDTANLRRYLANVATWIRGLPASQRDTFRFVYAGSDAARVTTALREIPLGCETLVTAQLPIAEFAKLARGAFANSYLCAPNATGFHHKLLELLVCGQPLICCPAESAESQLLASKSDTPFASCNSAGELRDALTEAWQRRHQTRHPTHVPAWRWANFAATLEGFFMTCARNGST